MMLWPHCAYRPPFSGSGSHAHIIFLRKGVIFSYISWGGDFVAIFLFFGRKGKLFSKMILVYKETCLNHAVDCFISTRLTKSELKQHHSGGDLKTKGRGVPQCWTVKSSQVIRCLMSWLTHVYPWPLGFQYGQWQLCLWSCKTKLAPNFWWNLLLDISSLLRVRDFLLYVKHVWC
jgi:hypothetical protein